MLRTITSCCAVLALGACGAAKAPPRVYHQGIFAASGGGGGGGGGAAAQAEPTSVDLSGARVEASGDADDKPPPQRARQPVRGTTKRMVIKSADLTILTSDPKDGFEKALRMAKEMGGYTLNSHRSEKRLRVTLRVPAARFEEALRRLSKLGTVDKRSINGRDVSTEFVDLTMRLKNAERVRQRYLELLQKAQNVTEALQVQKELERITGQIESFKGRLTLIENQVSLSTVNLTLETPTRPGPVGWIFYGLYRGILWLFVWD